LQVSAEGSTDADEDPISYSYKWFKEGEQKPDYDDETTIPAAATAKSETWKCVVTPNDGEEDGPSGEDQVTVDNTPPSIDSVEITPEPAHTDDVLTGTPNGWSDPDDDDEGYHWQWQKKDGEQWQDIEGATADTLSSDNFVKGDQIRVVCTPWDGTEEGEAKTDQITISNSPPTQPAVEVAPDSPKTNNELTVSASGSDDADDDEVSYSYKWYKDDEHQSDYDDQTTIPASATAKGETWKCIVTPNDGEEDGPSDDDQVTIANSAPTQPAVDVQPDEPDSTDDLVCGASGSTDADEDTVTYSYRWYRDAEHQADYDDEATVPAAATAAGEIWRCVVTPSDGESEGPSGEDAVGIGVPPPHEIRITQGVGGEPNPVASGGQVQCSVTAEDSLGHDLTYQWTAEDDQGNPAGSFDDGTAQNPTWTAPDNLSAQVAEYTITVTVTCSQDETVSASASYAQQVNPLPHEVTITGGPAGEPNSVSSGGQVQCSVSAEDSWGHALTYQWTANDGEGNPAGSFDDPTLASPKWTAPANSTDNVVEYTITVTVKCSEEGNVNCNASYVQRVNPAGHDVLITGGPAGDPNPVASGGEVRCSVAAEDTRGHDLTYQWVAMDGDGNPAGSFDDPAAQCPTWTSSENASDEVAEYTITVTVTCSEDGDISATASYTQQVEPVAHEMRITEAPAGDANPVPSGGEVHCSVSANDSRQGHTLTYDWTAQDAEGNPAGTFDDNTAEHPTWTAPEVGVPTDYTISVTVRCSADASISAQGSFGVQVLPVLRHTFAGEALMVGVPIQPNFTGFMEDLLGADAVARWNAAEQQYVGAAVPSSVCVLGEGCWARFGSEQTVEVPGTPYVGDLFRRHVEHKWNLVALPWNQNLAVAAMSSDPPGKIDQFTWTYYGGDYHLTAAIKGLPGVGTDLEPWRAYWVYAKEGCDLILDRGVTPSSVEPMCVGDKSQDDVWVIQVVASAGGMTDRTNYCGVSPQGDALDIPNPPIASGRVDLYFTSDRGAKHALEFCTHQPGGSFEWDFEVLAPAAGQETRVACPDLSSVPSNYKVYLIDQDADKTVYMRTTRAYRYVASSQAPRHFVLRVVDDTHRSVVVTGLATQQVNASQATISYTLSAQADATIRVYNIAGRCVRSIAQGRPTAPGLHSAAWDLRSDTGSKVPSGLYLVQVTARTEEGAQVSVMSAMTIRK